MLECECVSDSFGTSAFHDYSVTVIIVECRPHVECCLMGTRARVLGGANEGASNLHLPRRSMYRDLPVCMVAGHSRLRVMSAWSVSLNLWANGKSFDRGVTRPALNGFFYVWVECSAAFV